MSYKEKAAIIRAKVLPKALYGCEAADFPDELIRSLRSAIARTISNGAQHQSIDLTFAVASHGSDLDPVLEIFTRRCMAFRRMTAKYQNSIRNATDTYQLYKQNGQPGTDDSEETLATLEPAPPPGAAGRKFWKPIVRAKGPIGLLIQDAHLMGAAITPNFCLVKHNESPIDLLRCPI